MLILVAGDDYFIMFIGREGFVWNLDHRLLCDLCVVRYVDPYCL
jgi:hypothetical protein